MNVPPLSRTSVTPTPCVQTPKGPMYVAAGEDLKGTEGTVQVYTINPSMRRHFFSQSPKRVPMPQQESNLRPLQVTRVNKGQWSVNLSICQWHFRNDIKCEGVFTFTFLEIPTTCSPPCSSNAQCQQGAGGPRCVCRPGYQGDGYNCTGKVNLRLSAPLNFNMHRKSRKR